MAKKKKKIHQIFIKIELKISVVVAETDVNTCAECEKTEYDISLKFIVWSQCCACLLAKYPMNHWVDYARLLRK